MRAFLHLLFNLSNSSSKGGCLMSSPCLESQGCHLIPLYHLLSCSSAESCYSFCFIFFSACWPILLKFFQSILQYFSLRDRPFFWYGSCLAARRKLVSDMCSMLPYDTDICCYAFIYIFFITFVHSFFYTLKKSCNDK